jgi:hypothetical protein
MPAKRPDAEPLLEDFARDVIARRQLTPYAVAKASRVAASQLTRFFNRERGLSGVALGKVCRALGLYLAEGRGGLR